MGTRLLAGDACFERKGWGCERSLSFTHRRSRTLSFSFYASKRGTRMRYEDEWRSVAAL